MQVDLMDDDLENGDKVYIITFSKSEMEQLEKLTKFRKMDSIEQTIEASLVIEIEAMYYWNFPRRIT